MNGWRAIPHGCVYTTENIQSRREAYQTYQKKPLRRVGVRCFESDIIMDAFNVHVDRDWSDRGRSEQEHRTPLIWLV